MSTVHQYYPYELEQQIRNDGQIAGVRYVDKILGLQNSENINLLRSQFNRRRGNGQEGREDSEQDDKKQGQDPNPAEEYKEFQRGDNLSFSGSQSSQQGEGQVNSLLPSYRDQAELTNLIPRQHFRQLMYPGYQANSRISISNSVPNIYQADALQLNSQITTEQVSQQDSGFSNRLDADSRRFFQSLSNFESIRIE